MKMKIIKKIPQLLWLNFLWLICSLPLITLGTSTCAAFAVALRLSAGEAEVMSAQGIAKRFFKAFRQDLLQGFLIMVFTLCGVGLGAFLAYHAWDSGLNIIKVAGLFIYLMLVLIFNFYSYALIARYSNTFVNVIRNSLALFAQYPDKSLKTLGIVVVEFGLLYLTRYVWFCGFLFMPAVIVYTVSCTAKDIFFRLENPEPVDEKTE